MVYRLLEDLDKYLEEVMAEMGTMYIKAGKRVRFSAAKGAASLK